jgi:hypothetical protein
VASHLFPEDVGLAVTQPTPQQIVLDSLDRECRFQAADQHLWHTPLLQECLIHESGAQQHDNILHVLLQAPQMSHCVWVQWRSFHLAHLPQDRVDAAQTAGGSYFQKLIFASVIGLFRALDNHVHSLLHVGEPHLQALGCGCQQ